MVRRFLALIIFFSFSQLAIAQDDCGESLTIARNELDAGHVERIPGILFDHHFPLGAWRRSALMASGHSTTGGRNGQTRSSVKIVLRLPERCFGEWDVLF